MSKVPSNKFGGDGDSKQGATSASGLEMESRSTTEKLVTIKQSKFPVLPFARMLDEESWLSGSELKTDNSTSEDEEVRRTFVGGTKTKLRSKGKKRISSIRKVMTFSTTLSSTSTCSTSKSYHRMSESQITGSAEDLEEGLISATRSMWSSTTSHDGNAIKITGESEEKQWRPKRGSITLLPGLIEQIESPL